MNKKDLAARTAAKTGMTVKQSRNVVNVFCEAIMTSLAAGESVQLKDFGTFEVYDRSPYTGRNPKTGECFVIPAGKRIRFRSRKLLQAKVRTSPERSS